MKRRICLLFMLILACFTGAPSYAATVSPGQGLTFHQLDFTFAAATQFDSRYGMAIADFSALATATGIGNGYLNIVTGNGWVVRNMPIDIGAGLPGMSVMFDLGAVGDIANLTVLADLSPAPSVSFSGTPSSVFSVTALAYNAEGFGGTRTAVPAPINLTSLVFNPLGVVERFWQSLNPSIEQDTNQCLPASVANSFQWLENTSGIPFPHNHVPGIRDNSLVGQLDQAMGRLAHQPTGGLAGLQGKLAYLDANGLGARLDIKHKNRVGGNMLPATVTVGGTTSRGNTDAMTSLIDWVIAEVRAGEDVELGILWDGGGGHFVRVVGGGRVFGIHWISWVHDANQGFNPNGPGVGDDTTALNGGNGLLDGGYGWSPVVNGRVLAFPGGFSQAGTLEIAYSESPKPPKIIPVMTGAGLVISVLILALAGALRLGSHFPRQPKTPWKNT